MSELENHGTDAPEPDTIVVEFELTPEDWTAAAAVHLSKSPILAKSLRKVQALFVAIWVVLALLEILQGEAALAAFCVFLGVAAVPFLPALTRASQRNHLKKVAMRGLANGTFGTHRVELGPEGMRDATSGYEWLTRWSSIERVEMAEDIFLIYTGPQAFLPIPNSAFRDSATLRAFGDRFFQGLGMARQGLPETSKDRVD